MSRLFENTEINGMQLKNRFVRSATYEGMATDDGACTPELTDLVTRLTKGGVGLIISSHAYVRPEGQAGFRQLGIYHDRFIDNLRDMVTAVHNHEGRIVLQITHGGFFSDIKLIGRPPLAPSAVEGIVQAPREEMTTQEIHAIIDAFGHAAARGKEAGFDGIQIHAAHGYLLSQFLTPAFNHRGDEYGGPLENRARALLEVLAKVRDAVGNDMPVLVKMNCRDFHDHGLELKEALSVAKLLQENGIDAIEVSGGGQISGRLGPVRLGIKSEDKEAYFREEAKVFKRRLDVPIMLVGGIRSFNMAEMLLNDGYADYISMSRPFIREPDLIARWAAGDISKAGCISDSRCLQTALDGKGMFCVMKEA